MKKIIILIILTIVLCYSFTFGNSKSTDIDKILTDIKDSDNIRIIIRFDVPELEKLTAESRKHKTGNMYRISKAEVRNTDRRLSAAISNSAYDLLHSLNGNNYSQPYIFKTIPYIAISVDLDTLNKLETLQSVNRIFHDKPIPLPKYEKIIKNENTNISKPMLGDSIDIIGADTAWGFGLTGKDWFVAILDTGIRRTHEMFSGKNIVEKCFSTGQNWYDKKNGDCPNGQIEMSGSNSASHYEDRFDHGSHVSGIAAGNNHKDLYGVAKDANIIAVQVFSYFSSEDEVMSWSVDQLKGLEYVYSLRGSYNIASINMSLGGNNPYSKNCDGNELKPIIDNLKAVGIATVISSGNNGFCNAISSPACISSAVSVDGSSKYDQEYSYGNWQNEMLDLIAPGSRIKSVVGRDDSSYGEYSGTSMAAPHVAGAWAILKQHNPNFTVNEILSKLKEGGTQINQKSSCGNFSVTKPRIDLDTTVSNLFPVLPPSNFSVEKQINRSLLQTEYLNVLSWTANPRNANNDVVSYKIYLFENNNLTHLSTIDANEFTYYHRNVGTYTEMTYAITAINGKGQESVPYYFTITF